MQTRRPETQFRFKKVMTRKKNRQKVNLQTPDAMLASHLHYHRALFGIAPQLEGLITIDAVVPRDARTKFALVINVAPSARDVLRSYGLQAPKACYRRRHVKSSWHMLANDMQMSVNMLCTARRQAATQSEPRFAVLPCIISRRSTRRRSTNSPTVAVAATA